MEPGSQLSLEPKVGSIKSPQTFTGDDWLQNKGLQVTTGSEASRAHQPLFARLQEESLLSVFLPQPTDTKTPKPNFGFFHYMCLPFITSSILSPFPCPRPISTSLLGCLPRALTTGKGLDSPPLASWVHPRGRAWLGVSCPHWLACLFVIICDRDETCSLPCTRGLCECMRCVL